MGDAALTVNIITTAPIMAAVITLARPGVPVTFALLPKMGNNIGDYSAIF